MRLETKSKQVNIVLRTRNIVLLAKGKDISFEDNFFKAYSENNTEYLGEALYVFAEDDNGNRAFKNVDEVYDFIDDYRIENKTNQIDIYSKLAEALNTEGFFKKKMTKVEIQETLSNPLSNTVLTDLTKKVAEKAINNMAQKEFQGYQA